MSSARLQSFGAICGQNPRILILGSMPGVASLDAQQYYAHPRNRFWPVMATLLRCKLPPDYRARLHMLTSHRIALWDVLAECQRLGSLDSAIETATQRPNRIPELLDLHPSIQLIATNGGHASRSFLRYFPNLRERASHQALPSTSPANARWQLPQLVDAWSVILAPHHSA